MEKEKGLRLFDNYDDDGQFRLFDADFDDWDEDWEEEPAVTEEPIKEPAVAEEKTVETAPKKEVSAPKVAPPPIVPQEEKYSGPEIRVRYCSTCGKLLFVKEDADGYHSECNHCEIKYFQKA